MSTPEQSDASYGPFGLPESRTEIDQDKAARVAGAINALTVEFPSGGNLSNLVWNTRNLYMSSPDAKFDAPQVQMIVEGFLTELELLRTTTSADPNAR